MELKFYEFKVSTKISKIKTPRNFQCIQYNPSSHQRVSRSFHVSGCGLWAWFYIHALIVTCLVQHVQIGSLILLRSN